MLKLLLDEQCIDKNANAYFYLEWGFLYASRINGLLRSDLVSSFMPDSITIVHGDNVKVFETKSGKVEIVSGVFYFDNGFDIELHEQVQSIIVRRHLFKGYCSIPKNLYGIKKTNHGYLISALFESIRDENNTWSNGVMAIANVIAISILESESDNSGECEIYEAISNNHKDINFSLDDLCNIFFMSRRKIQYILSKKGWTFTSILRMYRVNTLKRLLKDKDSLSMRYFEITSHKAGYDSLEKANRDFKKVEGITVRGYVKRLKGITQ